MLLRCVAHYWELDGLTQGARARTSHGCEVYVEEDGVVQQHLSLEARSSSEQCVVTAKARDEPDEHIRDDQEDVQEDGLLSVEASEVAEPLVVDDTEIHREEDDNLKEPERIPQVDGGLDGEKKKPEEGKLHEKELAVLEPVEEGQKIADGVDRPFRSPDVLIFRS